MERPTWGKAACPVQVYEGRKAAIRTTVLHESYTPRCREDFKADNSGLSPLLPLSDLNHKILSRELGNCRQLRSQR